ncbi:MULTISPECIES: hypothetical protein [Corallococcus]|uniref:hypothetical protein n=1 Tax=Corallococcus TaxID=83461 RepID=UPI00117F12B8|nr:MULTISPECIES: hypothetical protein [Corallococcus]NBD09366.1 hypothetical protein [Corallococcus silvisoli]TSC31327.1 hypothetical protein FOF48_11635 [Corallococcus sp. Z5C101001]
MHQRWMSAVGWMAVGFVTLSSASAGAEDVKAANKPVQLAPRTTAVASTATKSSGTVDVAVDDGAKGTRLYRYDRSSGKLTLVKQVTQKDSASATSSLKDLAAVERGTSLMDPGKGGAVSPEGKPPKGGPPGGDDPGLITQADLANIKRELSVMKVQQTQVKVGTQARR